MAGTTVPVTPGKQSTQLTGAPLARGATIYNQDSVNSVWVSNSPNVSPGNGQLVGPLGNAQWNNDNEQAYACVGAGVTSAVSVVVSGDVSGVSNPVALAAATANLLLAQGIPNVFQGTLILNAQLPFGVFQYTVPGDLSQYASLAVNLNAIGPQQLIRFTWLTAPGSNNIVSQHNYLATGNDTGQGSDLEFVMPVEAPTLRIDFTNGTSSGPISGTLALIYASNRPVSASVRNLDLSVDYIRTQAWANNTVYRMGQITTNGGLHSARMLSTATGSLYFGYRSCDRAGNVAPVFFYKTTPGQDAYQNIVLPRGCVELVCLTAVVATYVGEFSITPPGV